MQHRGISFALLLVMSLSATALAQLENRKEIGVSFTYLSGNGGLDGFTPEIGYRIYRPVTLIGQADFLWSNSRLGAFDLTPGVGAVRVNSNEQNFLGGARVRIGGWGKFKTLEEHRLFPFGELLFGVSRLSQTVGATQTTQELSASASGFVWVLGGGVEYALTPKWLARGKVDFLRTHYNSAGQSHFRFSPGLAYRF